MDDKPTNEEPTEDPKLESTEDPQAESNEEPKKEPQKESKKEFNPLDLSQLQSFSFGTEWTKDKAEPGSGDRRRDDRPRRDGPRDDRKDRRGFKRSRSPVGGGEDNRDRRGGGGDRAGRGPGQQGQGQGQGRPRSGGGPRGDHRGGPSAPLGPYISPHFDATFYPEDVSFAALAKTIRSSARTFELFDIAKTVIGKNDRFVVVLERKPGAATTEEGGKKPFHVCLLDGIPFETEEAAMNHITQKHMDRFFGISEQETEPPKGSFQVINKCGVTGELLGPPNYHRYTQIVQQHHATRLARMDFERFSSRIESVRDPEVVDQWLESMKKVTRYTWLGDENVPVKPAATDPTKESDTETDSAPTDDAPAPDAAVSADEAAPVEVVAPVDDEAAPAVDAPVEEPAADAGGEESTQSTDSAPAESAAEAPATAEPASEVPVAAPVPSFDSINDAKVHLITHARDKAVRLYEHGRFHGRALDDMPDGEIKRAVQGALERQQRFPLDTANALRGRLRREGFTIFKKGSKGISYVSAVKRKFRVAGQSFADSINDLITFVEKNPMVKVSELTEKFLGIAPLEAPAKSETDAPTATTPGTVSPFGEADQPRIKRMQLDLRWLVTEGYVTEFIDGTLFAAPPMPPAKPKPPPAAPAPKSEAPATEAPAAQVADTAAPAETPAAPEPVATPATPAPAEAEAPATPESEPAPEVTAPEPTPEPELEVPPAPVIEPPAETPAEPVAEPAPAPEPVVEPETVPEPKVTPAPESVSETPKKTDSDFPATEGAEEKPEA